MIIIKKNTRQLFPLIQFSKFGKATKITKYFIIFKPNIKNNTLALKKKDRAQKTVDSYLKHLRNSSTVQRRKQALQKN
jgi:hypothetical protein